MRRVAFPHRLGWFALLIHCVGLFNSPASAQPVDENRRAELEHEVSRHFGLSEFHIEKLGPLTITDRHLRGDIWIDGEPRCLVAMWHSPRSQNYRLLVQIDDGPLVEHPPGPVRTFRGKIQGEIGSSVVGGLVAGQLTAAIDIPRSGRFWVEPLAGRIAGAQPDEYVVYQDTAPLDTTGLCGVAGTGKTAVDDPQPATPRGVGCGPGVTCVAELAADSDYEYFVNWGSIANVEARITTIISTINVQYERDVDIIHEISTIIVRTTPADPYSATTAENALDEFTNYWNANQGAIPRDIAHLFCGRDFSGGFIGFAWFNGICSSTLGYGIAESDWSGSFACVTDLSAHELGHNWNAPHCSCSSYTMNPNINCNNLFHETHTVPVITAYRDAAGCLSPPDIGSTTIPFFDAFSTTTIDDTLWTFIDGAESNTLGSGEHSAPYALNISGSNTGGDQVRTAVMDASAYADLQLSYWWQRTGNGNSPESGDDLIVEYLSSSLTWQQVASHPGSGSDSQPFVQQTIDLPTDANHAAFRVRFRTTSFSHERDDWFVDDVSIDGCFGATINTQPTAQGDCPGGSVVFNVDAMDPGPLSYQWTKDGFDIPGEQSTALTINNLSQSDEGFYACRVTNSCGPLLTHEVFLDVLTAAGATSGSQPIIVHCAGETAEIVAIASGSPPFVYDWQKEGLSIGAPNLPTLTLVDVIPSDTANYTCMISNTCGSEVTTASFLAVNGAGITQHPASTCVNSGQDAVFQVLFETSFPIVWTWYRDGQLLLNDPPHITGADTDTLTITGVTAGDAANYYASLLTNIPQQCINDSNLATLTVNGCPCLTLGDLNCDGIVDPGDIGPFALALTDPIAYTTAFPGGNISLADMNTDGNIDGRDVAGFTVELISP